jgi:2,3-dihydroxyphenylpropionate 1,2-dioxygenase
MTAPETSAGDKIVAAFSLTHTPGLGDRLDECPPDQMASLERGFRRLRDDLEAAAPDLIVAFVNDHFDMYWLNNMPTFAVGVSDVHYGPSPDAEAWIGMDRRPHPGNEDYAKDILVQGIADGFDLTRAGPCEFNHNILIPKKFIWPDRDIPVVPIFINCFAPPLPTWRRCYDLGRSIAGVIARRPERVALCASGGISHWPPYVPEDVPAEDTLLQRQLKVQREGPVARQQDPALRDDFHAREAEMAATDRDLVNVDWDLEVLKSFERGDADYFLTAPYADVERRGGNGGHEMAMWVALMAVLGGAPGELLTYEAVKPWMGGVGLMAYDLAGR